MPNRSQTAATLHAEIGGSTYAAPATATHSMTRQALAALGVLNPATGAYLPGRGQADVDRALGVPGVAQEQLLRLCAARGV
jgi:malate/lactate dehydrogenase